MPNNHSLAKNFFQAFDASIYGDISKGRRIWMGTTSFLSYGMTTGAELLSDPVPFLGGVILGMRRGHHVSGG
jgi:hypothetical protein